MLHVKFRINANVKCAMLRESSVKTKVNFKAKEAEINTYVYLFFSNEAFIKV